MMLRKRTRSHPKDQAMIPGSDSVQADFSGQNNHNSNSLFSIPGLFLGLSSKGLSDYDSVWSPTSPLDFRVFSNIGNPFARSPRSPQNVHQNGLGSGKVGLSLVGSLDDNMKLSGKIMRPSDSKNILFGPGMRIKNPRYQTHVEPFQTPKSLPKDYPAFPQALTKTPLREGNPGVIFEIGDYPLEPLQFGKSLSCSPDSYRPFPAHSSLPDRKTSSSVGNIYPKNSASPAISPHKLTGADTKLSCYSPMPPSLRSLSSSNGFIESLSASEIELSEDYTCVITHGTKPKTTHIYGDHILECHSNTCSSFQHNEEKPIAKSATVYPSGNFLSFCHSCNKKLEEGIDIYIYRGDKAFCSSECRSPEILFHEEMEEAKNSPKSDNAQELFESGVIFTT